MAAQIDYNDPRYAQAAAEILRRHDNGEPEANITSTVRDFLILTGLASGEELVEENPPAQGSRRAVDLTALDTFIEFKRRIGTAGGFNPNAEYVQQLDDYLEQSEKQGRIRIGILTDGKRWLLRWPNAGPVRTALPYAVTLEDSDRRWITLFEWLRDHALSALDSGRTRTRNGPPWWRPGAAAERKVEDLVYEWRQARNWFIAAEERLGIALDWEIVPDLAMREESAEVFSKPRTPRTPLRSKRNLSRSETDTGTQTT